MNRDASAVPVPGAEGLNALAMDTTSEYLSLALLVDGRAGPVRHAPLGRAMAREILPAIDALLGEAGLTPAALNLLLVAQGPGSFTGTRIGMGVALTFAQVLGRPLVGVDALTILAAQSDPAREKPFHVLLNCAREEVYHGVFAWREGLPGIKGDMRLTDITTLAPDIGTEPVLLRRFAPTAPGGKDPAGEQFAALATLTPHRPRPEATRLLEVGLGRYLRLGRPAAAALPPVQPIYLKSEAFRTWKPKA